MRNALLALLLLTGSAQAQELSRACDSATWFQHVAATGPVQVVPGKPGQRVYFCGFTVMQKGPTLDLTVTVGEGPTCAINTIQITPRLSLPNDFALSNRIASGQPLGQPGTGICIQTFGSGGLAGIFYFTQWGP